MKRFVFNRIKTIRNEKGIKQNDMAKSLGVSRQTMTAIENMKYNPSLELTLKIAAYFNLSVEEIFELRFKEGKR